MYLDPQYIKENSSIVLNFPMKPRFITPHPFANQAIIGVARGPLVYCVEDVDNTWVDDHFKVTPDRSARTLLFHALR